MKNAKTFKLIANKHEVYLRDGPCIKEMLSSYSFREISGDVFLISNLQQLLLTIASIILHCFSLYLGIVAIFSNCIDNVDVTSICLKIIPLSSFVEWKWDVKFIEVP